MLDWTADNEPSAGEVCNFLPIGHTHFHGHRLRPSEVSKESASRQRQMNRAALVHNVDVFSFDFEVEDRINKDRTTHTPLQGLARFIGDTSITDVNPCEVNAAGCPELVSAQFISPFRVRPRSGQTIRAQSRSGRRFNFAAFSGRGA